MRPAVRLQLVALIAAASAACAAVEGLGAFSECADHCGEGHDATAPGPEGGPPPGSDAPVGDDTLGQDGPASPETGDDAGPDSFMPPPDAMFYPEALTDSPTDSQADASDGSSTLLDVSVPTDAALPDGTIPTAPYLPTTAPASS